MHILFVHQNFPGQYRHLAAAVADDPANTVVALGERKNLGRLGHSRVREVGYETPQGASPSTHHYLRNAEAGVRRGQAVVRTAIGLRDSGFRPDVICCHPAWGEGLYLRDVWPEARILFFYEFSYGADGRDLGFDPEFVETFDDRFRVRTKNTVQLISLDVADWGVSPTRWQHSTYPDVYRPRISVIHDGIDTSVVTPDPAATLSLGGGVELRRSDEVITYVARNLEPYRGFHIFMRALPLILERRPNARVLVVGGDDVSYGRSAPEGRTWREHCLQEQSGRIDPNRVHFLGKLPYSTYLTVLRLSSAHVYLTYPFVLSWSMLEAMSAGCMVVGSRTPPVEEVIADGENGILFDFFRPDEIAAAVDRVFAHPDRMQAVRDAARTTAVERYDLRTVCLPAHMELVRTLAAGRLPDATPDTPPRAVARA